MSAFSRFKEIVAAARREAHAEARESFPFIRSRGTFLCTAAANGDQCDPNPEAEAIVWTGAKLDIEHLVDSIQSKYTGVAEIYIAGGYDGAETLQVLTEGDYEPWVSSWKVTVWKRNADGTITGYGRTV